MKKHIDHRMHSAEHILNQTMVRMFGCNRCFSSHLEKKKSKCDYVFDHALTKAETKEIEKQVNDIIRSDISVTQEHMPREAAQQYYSMDRLPWSAGNDIRIVKIGNFDACPCIGPHVSSTGEIGIFRIVSSGFENEVLRIRFRLAPLS